MAALTSRRKGWTWTGIASRLPQGTTASASRSHAGGRLPAVLLRA
jgi:hypothetical protein